MTDPILGQEAICPDGLGRVSEIEPLFGGIRIDTYINNRGCVWDPKNVELIDPRPPKQKVKCADHRFEITEVGNNTTGVFHRIICPNCFETHVIYYR